jgi:hypothetical protein
MKKMRSFVRPYPRCRNTSGLVMRKDVSSGLARKPHWNDRSKISKFDFTISYVIPVIYVCLLYNNQCLLLVVRTFFVVSVFLAG